MAEWWRDSGGITRGSNTFQRQKGALLTVSTLPFGKFLLVIMMIGLFAFAIWCFIQAIFDFLR